MNARNHNLLRQDIMNTLNRNLANDYHFDSRLVGGRKPQKVKTKAQTPNNRLVSKLIKVDGMALGEASKLASKMLKELSLKEALAKKIPKELIAKKSVAKKSVAKKSVAKKSVAKKSVPKKVVAKKAKKDEKRRVHMEFSHDLYYALWDVRQAYLKGDIDQKTIDMFLSKKINNWNLFLRTHKMDVDYKALLDTRKKISEAYRALMLEKYNIEVGKKPTKKVTKAIKAIVSPFNKEEVKAIMEGAEDARKISLSAEKESTIDFLKARKASEPVQELDVPAPPLPVLQEDTQPSHPIHFKRSNVSKTMTDLDDLLASFEDPTKLTGKKIASKFVPKQDLSLVDLINQTMGSRREKMNLDEDIEIPEFQGEGVLIGGCGRNCNCDCSRGGNDPYYDPALRNKLINIIKKRM